MIRLISLVLSHILLFIQSKKGANYRMLNALPAFEPGSYALAAYLIQINLPLHKRKYSCRRVKQFIRRHKEGLVDVAVEEIADPTLELVNVHTQNFVDIFHHFPLPATSYFFTLYVLILIITILV